MKIIVNAHKCEIDKTPVNELEINITKCEFEFAEEITSDFVKEAYFTLNGETYKQIIVDNECDIPGEVLEKKGTVKIGVVAYLVEDEDTIKRYNPSPAYFNTWEGSLKDAENSEPITPTDKEQIEQRLNEVETEMDNMDVDAEKEEHTTTITITKKDGTQKTVQVLDGEKGDKGDKGEPGAIKMIIVSQLPATGDDDTIYLVPLAIPESQENNYAEYVYINGAWELLGKIGIQVDLTDYVKNTDYATSQKGGVIKIYQDYGTDITGQGRLCGTTKIYSDYLSGNNAMIISKGTLENVITGKDLTTKAYVDGLVGDINTALDAINGEVL